MSTFSITIQAAALSGNKFEEIEALVDTGATTTVIPRVTLERLGISPMRRETFEYASGEHIVLDMAQARVQVQERETITWVIFGEEGMAPLLGAYTLEGVFLGVDPYNQRLIPITGLLK